MNTPAQFQVGEKVVIKTASFESMGTVVILPGPGSYRQKLGQVAVQLSGGTATLWIHPRFLEMVQ